LPTRRRSARHDDRACGGHREDRRIQHLRGALAPLRPAAADDLGRELDVLLRRPTRVSAALTSTTSPPRSPGSPLPDLRNGNVVVERQPFTD
jgi:hypothetical protein